MLHTFGQWTVVTKSLMGPSRCYTMTAAGYRGWESITRACRIFTLSSNISRLCPSVSNARYFICHYLFTKCIVFQTAESYGIQQWQREIGLLLLSRFVALFPATAKYRIWHAAVTLRHFFPSLMYMYTCTLSLTQPISSYKGLVLIRPSIFLVLANKTCIFNHHAINQIWVWPITETKINSHNSIVWSATRDQFSYETMTPMWSLRYIRDKKKPW